MQGREGPIGVEGKRNMDNKVMLLWDLNTFLAHRVSDTFCCLKTHVEKNDVKITTAGF